MTSTVNHHCEPVAHHISILFVLDSAEGIGNTLIIDFNHYDQ